MVAAAIALIVSLSGSSAPPSSTAAAIGTRRPTAPTALPTRQAPGAVPAAGDHADHLHPDIIDLDDRGRGSGRPARDLLVEPLQRLGRAERDGRRRQLLEHERSDRGDLQRSSGADELPRPEHLHGHRAAVDRTLGSGGDHDGRGASNAVTFTYS